MPIENDALAYLSCPVGRGCRIQRMLLCRGVKLAQGVSCGPVGRGCRIQRMLLCRGVKLAQRVSCGPVGRGCRIQRMLLCRGVKLAQRVSVAQSAGAVEYTDCISAKCYPPPATSVLYMTLNNRMVRFKKCWALNNAMYPFLALAPRSTLARSGSTW